MNLTELPLKISYESRQDDLLSDFYIPALSCANRYDRITGFFSSSSLAIAARGIAGLIQNQGKMRLITCQRFSPGDVSMLKEVSNSFEDLLGKQFITAYSQIEDQFQKDHIKALGWMLKKGYLEIKIALVYKNHQFCTAEEINNTAIMHQKVGLLYDSSMHAISFSGSNNESASGWLDNIEEFKVFKNWEAGQKDYFQQDEKKFAAFWHNQYHGVKVIDLPVAVEDKLLHISRDFEVEKIALKRYFHRHTARKKEKLALFSFQKEAVAAWKANHGRLLFEMATGTGKTRTAIGCLQLFLTKQSKNLTIIACPQVTLAQQWQRDIEKLDLAIQASLFIVGGQTQWQRKLHRFLMQINTGLLKGGNIIYITHDLAWSKKFIQKIALLNQDISIFFIADEAHGLGAQKRRKSLLERYDYRLALSATPRRWFDDVGSAILYRYFGQKSFIFSLEQALRTINPLTGYPFLVNYWYYPCFLTLTEEELEEYNVLTAKIRKMSYAKASESKKEEIRQSLSIERAEIAKNAEGKYRLLEKVLDKIGPKIRDTIIFVVPEQLDRVLMILGRRQISAHRFTKDEGTRKEKQYGGLSEREYLIHHFKRGTYQVLVAIKCLDEGIDIPSAKRAILMASSSNPREYVQRVGRIIRWNPSQHGKVAEIYDFIVKPDLTAFTDEFRICERTIFQKEMERVLDISHNALNNADIVEKMYQILKEVNKG